MRCRESLQNTLVSQHRPLFGNHRHLHHQRREFPRRIQLFAPVSLRKNHSGNLLVHKSRVHILDTCNHLLVRGSHRIPLPPISVVGFRGALQAARQAVPAKPLQGKAENRQIPKSSHACKDAWASHICAMPIAYGRTACDLLSDDQKTSASREPNQPAAWPLTTKATSKILP